MFLWVLSFQIELFVFRFFEWRRRREERIMQAREEEARGKRKRNEIRQENEMNRLEPAKLVS